MPKIGTSQASQKMENHHALNKLSTDVSDVFGIPAEVVGDKFLESEGATISTNYFRSSEVKLFHDPLSYSVTVLKYRN